MTTCMFPGQGSQAKGMGKDLFAQFPNEIKQINSLLNYSIEDLCFHDPHDQLKQTQYTQPALYVVEALTYVKKKAELRANYFLGHSLGEYSALFAAGYFDLMQGLHLVQKRGQLMAKAAGGAMLAVINLSEERIKNLLESEGLLSIEIASYNSTKQIVLAGLAPEIQTAAQILSKEASICVPLQVSGAFHSHHMQSIAQEFASFLEPFEFSKPEAQVISNVTARPHTLESIKNNLVQHLISPVQWAQSISYLKELGETEFIELGPGNRLSRLMSK